MSGEARTEARRLIRRGRGFAIYLERVTLPNGHTVDLDIVRHPGAAAVVPFLGEEEVLLIRQYRHAAGGTILEVPAGKLDGEEPEVCAARELEEETGYRPGRLERLGSILTTPGFTDERIHLFAAHDLERGTRALEEAEVIEVVPVRLEEALRMIWAGELVDGKSVAALLHAAHRVGLLVERTAGR